MRLMYWKETLAGESVRRKIKFTCLLWMMAQCATLGTSAAFAHGAASPKKQSAALNKHYEKAMDLYRHNKVDAALSIFADLHRRDAAQRQYLYDYLAIASWSGHFDLAVHLGQEVDVNIAPAYVLEAYALSQRERKKYESALSLYDLAIKRFPDRPEPRVGRVEALIDAQRLSEAESELARVENLYSGRQDVADAAVRLADADNSPMKALREAENLLKRDPGNRAALHMRFHALQRLGAAHLAAVLTPSSVLTRSEQIAVARDQRAFELRWARVAADLAQDNGQQSSRWKEMDRVIGNLQKICEQADAEHSASELARGGCADLVVALSDRSRMKDAIGRYEQMLQAKWAVPSYAQLAVARAYLYERQPEKARDIYAAALPHEPGDTRSRVRYVYALLESEQYDQAYEQIDRLSAGTNEWINPEYVQISHPNPDYTLVQLTSAMVRTYTDRPEDGQARLESLAQRAPYNSEIRATLASTYDLRGWHHRAEDELVWLRAVDPADLWIKVGLFESQMALGDYRSAEREMEGAIQSVPEESAVTKAQREWQTHNLSELMVDSRVGKSSDGNNASPFGDRERTFDARLYSGPVGYDWRFFVHGQSASAIYSGVNVARPAAGGGVEYRVRDLTLTGELLNIGKTGSGGLVSGDYHIGDHLSVNAGAEKNSLSAPLRAYESGVTADNILGGVTYRWDESRSVNLTANRMILSDHNRRTAAGVSWTERLVTGPVYKLDVMPEYYTSKNSLQSPLILYFNPIRDHFAGVTLRNEFTQINRYERSLRHEFSLVMGSYTQEPFAKRKVLNAVEGKYEALYSPDDRLKLHLGVGRSIHPYDGATVTENFATFSADWMF